MTASFITPPTERGNSSQIQHAGDHHSMHSRHQALVRLLHRDSVRPRRPRRKGRVEIHVEAWIERKTILEDLDDVDVMIPFEMNLAEVVFVQEVVTDDES